MNEVLDTIKEAVNAQQLHEAGNKMRAFLKDCEDKEVRDRILSVWQSKSQRMINPKRVTSNY